MKIIHGYLAASWAKIICLANLESGPVFDLRTKMILLLLKCRSIYLNGPSRALTMVLRALAVKNFDDLYKPEGFDNGLHHIELLKMCTQIVFLISVFYLSSKYTLIILRPSQ